MLGDAGLADFDAELEQLAWIRGAPHSALAMLISRISLHISAGTAGRPECGRDFQRQYDLDAESQEVVLRKAEAADGRFGLQTTVRAMPVVVMKPD